MSKVYKLHPVRGPVLWAPLIHSRYSIIKEKEGWYYDLNTKRSTANTLHCLSLDEDSSGLIPRFIPQYYLNVSKG